MKRRWLEYLFLTESVLLIILLFTEDDAPFGGTAGFVDFLTIITLATAWLLLRRSARQVRVTFRQRVSPLIQRRLRLQRFQLALQQLARDQVLHMGNPPDAFKKLCLVAARTLEDVRIEIWMFSTESAELVAREGAQDQILSGGASAHISLNGLREFRNELLKKRIVMHSDFPSRDEMLFPRAPCPGECMNASVLLDGDVVGVVAIAALDDARLITPDEQSFVASVADQVGLVLEIHKRISIERRLRESQEFLRAVIDLDPNLIFVKDETGRFTLVNQAVAAVYGAPVNQIVGKRDCDFNPNHDETSAFLNDDLRVIESGEELFIPEERITTASGEMRILQTVKRPLKIGGSSSRHVLGVSTDVTQMKQLYAQLMQSQKMEAIGQLAGGIAHDFNNILTGIIGYSDLLHDAGNDVEQVREISGSIQLAATRAAELTGKLLGFARKGKHQNVPVDMHDQIREALTILGRTVEKNILIVEKLDAVQSRVLGDPVQLEQIVFNLVINARDAMADKAASGKMGRLSLMTNIVQVGSDDAESLGVRAGRFLVLAVTDTGCGIPAKYREKIFEPFFTTKPLGEGTGMGLAMVYGIVRNHGGSVMVQSEEGQGTTFRVYLPILEGLEAHVEPLPPLRKPITGRGRILVVDDHAMIREVTADMLSALGYEVTVVEDGLEAVQYYRRSCSSLDLVILDLVMPRMGGIECFRALRQINRQVRVLLSTGYGKNLAVQELLNQGVYGFIQKPYHLSKLSEIVAEALSKDRLDAVGMPDHEQHVDA